MTLDEALRAAMTDMDQALAEKPEGDGALFASTAQHLSTARSYLIAHQRESGETPHSRQRLEHVNAVISVVLACRFPLGAIPWEELAKGRAWLCNLAHDCASAQTA